LNVLFAKKTIQQKIGCAFVTTVTCSEFVVNVKVVEVGAVLVPERFDIQPFDCLSGRSQEEFSVLSYSIVYFRAPK